jgi:hypothetical protein
MDIKDILSGLGLDFTNPEVKRGALEAIDAILASRQPITGGLGNDGGNTTTEVDIDPDLLQPSIKQTSSDISDDDIEIEDEENVLDQVKHNETEEPQENTSSSSKESDSDFGDSESSNTETDAQDENDGAEKGESGDADSNTNSDVTDKEKEETDKSSNSDEDTDEQEDEKADTANSDEDSDIDNIEDDESDIEDSDNADNNESNESDDESDDESDEESDDNYDDIEFDEDEVDFDEKDLLDDELKDTAEDEEIKTKQEARKIKRERTLNAAKKALEDAKAKKVAPALIRELEKAIEALEALTEAVTKSLKDISDAEFNQLVNRVFDAIQACGDSGLTFTSEEEREAQVKEIKDDLAKAETQNELSAEDAAKIRAETQALKAREKEADKYKAKSRSSFKGFQEFLNSLYRAIALQVHVEETRDDSWSALSRRNSGAGVLQQGKKVQELPNKKIPIIDFYFDQSGSWSEDDIKVGEKAVQSLADMEANGQIKINVYYFSDDVFTDAASARAMGGTFGWNEIVKNIIATQATNVIIMTDSDMEHWWNGPKALSYTVPGYVWYLWKRGSNAPRLPRDLKGRGGTMQFAFDTSDA